MTSPPRRRGRLLRIVAGAIVVASVPVVIAAAIVVWPIDPAMLSRAEATSTRVLARDGTVLGEGLSAEGARSQPLRDDVVPPRIAAAFLAVEDRRFLAHPGVDPLAIARAVKDSLRAGRIVSGASTITQQLARRLRPHDGGLVGKIGEALLALRLDRQLGKDRVLLEYCNRVPLGRNTIGVEAAAAAYFGTRAALLSDGQAALLAGLAHAPAREDPTRHPEAARARRDDVLRRMHRAGFLDDESFARASREPIEANTPGASPLLAPHVVARLRADHRGAAIVETTLDAGLQRAIEDIVRDEITRGPHRDAGLRHAAVVVLDNASGDVLAYVGSADFFDDESLGKNDGVVARRQPGSALKPFVYGRALERGLTPATVLNDVDTAFAVDDGGVFAPQNYDRRMHGPVTLRMALQNSYNVPAIDVARRLGAQAVLDVLHDAGFASLDRDAAHYGVGLVLGNGEVTLLELANAYRGLARGGVRTPVRLVRRVIGHDGVAVDAANPTEAVRFLAADVAALLTDILMDDAARAPAFGIDNPLHLPFDVAAKTGTSHAYVDNWTAGFTAERTVAVWAGSFDGTPMSGVSGISGAGVVFRRAMEAAMRGVDPSTLVDRGTFERARICPHSGLRAGPGCPAIDEVFLPGTAPTRSCDVHDGVTVDAVDAACAFGERPVRLAGALGAWARREGLCGARDVDDDTPALLSPRDGDVFSLEPGLPLSGQEIPLRIRGAVARVVVDGAVQPGVPRWLALGPGDHAVSVVFADGAAQHARFAVR